MGVRHRREEPDADGWSRWIQPVERGYRMSCCDCSLVHEMDFRVSDDGGRAQFRVKRHVRATAAMRAHDRRVSRETDREQHGS